MKIHWVGSKNQLVGRETTTRDEGMQAALYLREDLFALKSIVFFQSIVNTTRQTVAAFENPRVRTKPLEKQVDSTFGSQFCP